MALLVKWLIRFLILLCMVYGAMCASLYYSQRSMLYFPTPAPFKVAAENFELSYSDVRLRGWVVNPNKSNAVLYFGGNGEAVEQSVDFFKTHLPNTTVYLLPYRGYSGNPGQPSEDALFADALALYDQISPHHIRLRAIGRSLGSGVASRLAAERNIDKLILITPYDSVLNVAKNHYPIFPIHILLKDRFESWRLAPKIPSEVLILIAENDETIPRERTDNLIAHFKQIPQVKVFANAGHNTISDSADYSLVFSEFIESVEN